VGVVGNIVATVFEQATTMEIVMFLSCFCHVSVMEWTKSPIMFQFRSAASKKASSMSISPPFTSAVQEQKSRES
jgi:hypothetical protein